jgi:CRISPR-associated protein Csm2
MATQQYGNQNRSGNPNSGGSQQKGSQPRERETFEMGPWKGKIKEWITTEINSDTIDFADKLGKYVAENQLTTSQIRIFFGEMKKIQMNGFNKERTNFLLLLPKLAYAVKRHDKEGLKKLYEMFGEAYAHVKDEKDSEGEKRFNNAMQLTEAVLAYHKYHGGRE